MEEVSTKDGGSIERLTRGLRAGDEAAFRDFHAQYFDRLYQFLVAVARGQEQEAQEALQQTLLRVLRYVRVFQSEEAFWSWLKAVARSTARDAGRKQQRYAALLQKFAIRWELQAEPTRGPDEYERLHEVLEEILEQLPPAERELLETKYIEGTTFRELALQSGLSEKALESRLLRLRRELRGRLLDKLRLS